MLAGNILIAGGGGKIMRLVCITWLISKLGCYKLWLSGRLFPLVPIDDHLLSLPSFVHTALFIISLASMLLFSVFPHKRTAIIILIAELLSCMLDQNRWQPWEYQFLFMLGVFVFTKEEQAARVQWQLILASIFFFSGLGKLNSDFIHDVWQGLILHRWLGINSINEWLSRSGYALPLIEMAGGIGLLFNKTRRVAVWILSVMHLFILCLLGPTGLNINAVIWPWNMLMPLLLYYLFYRDAVALKHISRRKLSAVIVLLFWWLLPWLQLVGCWDKYLSSVLYSGGVEQLFICTEDPLAKKDMTAYLDTAFRVVPCSPVIPVFKWGTGEMNTAPYPEKRVYRAIIKAWQKKYPGAVNRYYIYKPGFSYNLSEINISSDPFYK